MASEDEKDNVSDVAEGEEDTGSVLASSVQDYSKGTANQQALLAFHSCLPGLLFGDSHIVTPSWPCCHSDIHE